MSDLPLALAITGASGTIYGKRLLETVLCAGVEVHLSISRAAIEVARHELDLTLTPANLVTAGFLDAPTDRLHCWDPEDYSAPVASGSFRTMGMAIVPCSLATVAAIATGQSRNLIHRAAEVQLKERRKLIVTPRETPLSLIALENMAALTRAGAVVLPAMPGFYHQPTTIDDLVDFVVARICDQLGVPVNLVQRWGEV